MTEEKKRKEKSTPLISGGTNVPDLSCKGSQVSALELELRP
jgi:hypothetical protein